MNHRQESEEYIAFRTVLIQSCHDREIDTIKYLLEKFPDLIDDTDDIGIPVFHYIIISGFKEIIEQSLAQNPELINNKNNDGWTILHVAANEGHGDIVEYLLRRFPTLIDEKTEDGYTALYIAGIKGYKDVIKHLLGECLQRIDDIKIAYYIARTYKHNEVIKYLFYECKNMLHVALDTQCESKWRYKYLYKCKESRLTFVQKLLETFPKLINVTYDIRISVLQKAIFSDDAELGKYLINNYPKLINHKSKGGYTILHTLFFGLLNKVCSLTAFQEITELLIKKSPSVFNEKDNNGNTVYDLALRLKECQNNSSELIQYLCEKSLKFT